MFIFERDRACVVEGQRERGQRIQRGLCDESSEPDVGLKLTNWEVMTRAKGGCLTR